MSRHLMAKMRRAGQQQESPDWRVGPAGWSEWAVDPGRGPDGEGWTQWNLPEEHQSAVVHHGESRYALEVKPNRFEPDPGGEWPDGRKAWTWGIFQHGPDHTIQEATDWTFPGNWKDRHTQTGSPASYFGHADSAEEAQREVERNWELHKQHVDSQNPVRGGDYDINDIMRGEGM